jgi:hypothetical protein
MTPADDAVVRFPHRSRRGMLLGLSGPQLLTAGLAVTMALAVMISGGLTATVLLSPLWAAFATLIWAQRGGLALAEWLPVLAGYGWRRLNGQLRWLARPSARPRREGLLHLPGAAASLRVVTAPSGRLAAVHDPHQATLTAIVRLTSAAFALQDPATQAGHVHGWGRTLAALARTGHIRAIQVLERTVPDSGDALARHWSEHGRPSTAVAGEIYADLIAAAGPAAAPHETYLSIALDLSAARRLISQAGGGLTGAFTVLDQLTHTVAQAARQAGVTPAGWLHSREIAALTRSAYDPRALTALQHWSPGPYAQVDPAAAGPIVQSEEPDRLRTDTACHATYWVHNWPRTDVHAGFLHDVLFASGVRRTISLHYRPAPVDAALRDVQRRKASLAADIADRHRRGRVDSEAHSMEWADITDRERQLVAGHADTALTGLITVSAADPDELAAASAQIETAAVSAQIDLRRLWFRQAQAFAAAALPFGLIT